MSQTVACRAFEATLLALDPDAAVPEGGEHPSRCAACAGLARELAASGSLLASIAAPAPSPELLARLGAVASTGRRPAAADPAEDVLALLSPGALAVPVPSGELAGRLAAIGRRPRPVPAVAAAATTATAATVAGADSPASSVAEPAPRPAPRPAPVREKVGLLAWLLGDWRILVAAAYAVALVFVSLLGIDPLSAARRSAGSLTEAGERALSEARTVAGARLEGVLEGDARKPFTDTLDYRIYRTLAIGKARTAAWTEILLHRIFGSATVPEEERQPAAPLPPAREPKGAGLRS